ncbi:hypothetical protein ABEB36_008278 [Hypothenemus hampei]|uniref:Uncharacterized protein n=1 Tax=Hypothenemus hampei TaxID=57062 RepID=A0ABD1EQD9_HYPHA
MDLLYSCFIICISILSLTGKGLTETCPTCRGSDCLTENTLQLDCLLFVPALPFENQLFLKQSSNSAKYGCLNLEYHIGDSIDRIQQCIRTNNIESFCSQLEDVINVEYCSVEAAESNLNVRNVQLQNDEIFGEEGSGESTIDPESTPEPTSTPQGTTTPSSGIHYSISFVFLVMSVIWNIIL